MNIHQLKTSADEFGISVHSAIRIRIRYLLVLIDRWEDYINKETNEMPESTTIDALNEIIRLKNYEVRLKKNLPDGKGITDEMIETARNTPIESVVTFIKGSAIAWCHDDRHASLMWYKKGNICTCFPCGKSFNAIDVLMTRDNYSFVDAVKRLAG